MSHGGWLINTFVNYICQFSYKVTLWIPLVAKLHGDLVDTTGC